MIAECRALLPDTNLELKTDGAAGVKMHERAATGGRLSSGALVLLRRNLEWLERWLERERERDEVVGG